MTTTKRNETIRFLREHKRSAKVVEVLYVETWATGYQQLLFQSHDKARAFAEARGANYVGPRVSP